MLCPLPLAYVYVAERFGVLPWAIEDAEADRVQTLLNLLGVEGTARADLDGLKPDEEMFWEDDEPSGA